MIVLAKLAAFVQVGDVCCGSDGSFRKDVIEVESNAEGVKIKVRDQKTGEITTWGPIVPDGAWFVVGGKLA